MLALAVASVVLSILNSIAVGFIAYGYLKSLKLQANRKILTQPELAALFIDDIRAHGYAVIRLDPDSLMVRSPR